MGALESRADALGEAVSLEFERRSWTWRGFRDEVQRTARALVHAGVQPGERIGVMAPNHDGFAVLFFALARVGAIMVTVNPEFGSDEAGYVLQHAGVSAVASTPDTLPGVAEAAAIPVPSELGEDEILVVVVAQSGATLEARNIARWCAQHLATIKRPRCVGGDFSLPWEPASTARCHG